MIDRFRRVAFEVGLTCASKLPGFQIQSGLVKVESLVVAFWVAVAGSQQSTAQAQAIRIVEGEQILLQDAPEFLDRPPITRVRKIQLQRFGALTRSGSHENFRFDQPLKTGEWESVALRIRAHYQVFRRWLEHHCELSLTQSHQLDELFADEVAARTALLAKTPPLAIDLLPVAFVTHGIGSQLFAGTEWNQKRAGILTEEQNAKLQAALQHRQKRLDDQLINHLHLQIAGLFHFTKDQNRKVIAEMKESLLDTKKRSYSIQPRANIYRFDSTLELLPSRPRNWITAEQQTVFTHMLHASRGIRQRRHSIECPIQSEGHEKVFQEALEINSDAIEQYRQQLLHHALVSLRHIADELDLNESEMRQFEIAAKGATHYEVEERKQTVKASYLKIIQQVGNGRLGRVRSVQIDVGQPDVENIGNHPMIQEALKPHADALAQLAQNKLKQQHAVRIGYLISLLDRELWLTEPQIATLKMMLDKKLAISQIETPAGIYELSLASFACLRLTDIEKQQVFSKPQQKTLSLMTMQYGEVEAFVDGEPRPIPQGAVNAFLRGPYDQKLYFEVPHSVN